jgi:hypothetical protein
MEHRIVLQNSQASIYSYLEDVLDYYKKSENASLAEWPTNDIGWEPFQKHQTFYRYVGQWFSERKIGIIRHNNSNRYLSTFILAAEFPPTLGYQRLVEELVHRHGWLALYRAPEENIEEYVTTIDQDNYTLAQKQSLVKDSEGYLAFCNLIKILASIRFYLDSYENLENICATVSTKQDWDLDLVLRIAHAYKNLLIPPHTRTDSAPSPQFSYQIVQNENGCTLFVKHNLNKRVSLPKPSGIELPRFSSGALTIFSDNQNLKIAQENQMVKLEEQEGYINVECSFSQNVLPVRIRDQGLKNIQFIISIKDNNALPQQLCLGKIHRQEDFLAFDRDGKEILTNTRLFRRGQVLRLVPLTKELWEALTNSQHFKQLEQTGLLPIFQTEATQAQVSIGKISLDFCSIPFSIKLREQTSWETAFNPFRTFKQYFYSPMMQFQLEGEFSGVPDPLVKLYRLHRNPEGKEIETLIKTCFKEGRIIPEPSIPSPGQYRLTVQFQDDRPSSVCFNLLPIKTIKLIEDKHIQIKFYSSIVDFKLQGKHPCQYTNKDDTVDIIQNDYGIQEIHAEYRYKFAEMKLSSNIKFRYEVVQEVVGHFSRIITPPIQETFSIENDLIPNSFLEFKKTSHREAAKPYRVSAYMECERHNRLFPEEKIMYTDGFRPYSLATIASYVKKHQFTRLLLIVDYEGIELYRVIFTDQRNPISDLQREWEQGAFSKLKILPLTTLEPFDCTDLENIPPDSLVYGMIEKQSGEFENSTYGKYIQANSTKQEDSVRFFLSACNSSRTAENNLLYDILQSPSESYQLMHWLGKSQNWRFAYDNKVYAKMLDRYPVIVAWVELARNPQNRDEAFALITPQAKFYRASGIYFYPQVVELADHPRFSLELLTLEDIFTLERLNLLPTDTKSFMKLFSFCTLPFVSGSKPVLSWLTLFWLRDYCRRNNLLNQFTQCFSYAKQMNQPLVTSLAGDFISYIPTYAADRNTQQNFSEMITSEQIHYFNPPLKHIPGLQPFLKKLQTENFSSELAGIIGIPPLIYAEPYLKGFKTSSKWKCVIFLSLTAVCKQLNRQPFLEKLQELWCFDHKTYIYLLKWINNHENTARIYTSYYQYWMTRFWEETNVQCL